MSHGTVMKIAPGAVLAAALGVSVPSFAQETSPLFELSRRPTSTMSNPYRLIESWPTLRPGMEWGAAIGLIPDGTGGTWMMFRSEPPINYINADGEITKSFGDGMIVQGLSRSLLNFASDELPVSAPSRLFYATSATAPSGGASASRAPTR